MTNSQSRIVLEPWQCEKLPFTLGQPVWLKNSFHESLDPISGFISSVYIERFLVKDSRAEPYWYDIVYEINPLGGNGRDIIGKLPL